MQRCELHPISIKLIKQGHPWVTLDSYSRRFPVTDLFVTGVDPRKQAVATLLHDPQHKTVRGRVWSQDPQWSEKNFLNDLEVRLLQAIKKREELASPGLRENKYWCFGEADFLPGLFLLQLKDQMIIQLYTSWWFKFEDTLIDLILKHSSFKKENLWLQVRGDEKNQTPPEPLLGPKREMNFALSENGFNIYARLGVAYDYGLYTDMAALRTNMKSLMAESPRVLNLYSYTGAFSLYALALDATEVVSVDLSGKYLEWLEENLKLNSFKGTHQSLKMATAEALKKLCKEGRQFDLIICDPPSSSSDGQKRSSALQSYEEMWPDFQKLLAPKGRILSFLNTHTVTMPKFESVLKGLESNKLKMQKKYFLQDDCPAIKGFPEGNYLKGILWQ
jgi:23S rRNA (cytosine1962-C5)-methyltransferase